ncbi:efflux RND transporter periplasmic adaptor subunit [Sulfurivirga sp.]|uniref:efflux RND transporter periplasmic adaptor subunit n=1 Tax=Sulfurivirga sp. TaxID=2614236 RepID=UPI0025D6A868|nr:efflux RND transporter periplasmic adaptor subunit [Sulfurivirga sp.]
MKHWMITGALALTLSTAPALWAEEGHQAAAGLELNAEQVKALGLQFAPFEPVARVEGYAWPAQVDIPLAHRDLVAAPVSGRIARIHVVHGPVKQGQPLFELDSAELVQMQQAYLDARARLTQAEKNFARAQRLYKAGSLSQKQYLAARTALETARNDKLARYEALLNAGLTLGQIKALAGGGKPVRTLTLHAPKDGLLFDLQVERNQRVDANAPLAHVGEIEPVVADVALPVSEVKNIHLGQTVTVDGLPIHGQVAYIARQADPETQRVSVHVRFDNAKGRLLPGQFIRVHFVEGTPAPAWRVPNRAVVDLEGTPAVFVREGKHIEARPVELIDRDGRWAIVALGEQPDADARVVSFGAIFLKGMMEGGEGEGDD